MEMLAGDRTCRLALAGKRIGVFGKGGAGKSTAVALLTDGLRKKNYEVCVLDADSTNFGLPQALGFEIPPEPLLAYFGGMVFSGGMVTCPVDDPSLLAGSEISLDELPVKYYRQDGSGITLMLAGKIGGLGPGAGCDGPVSKIARDLHIKSMDGDPVMLVDFKAGFEDTARGVITGLDWAVVVIDPTLAAVEMAFNMRDMISQIKQGILPATEHLDSPELVAIANRQFRQARIKGAVFLLNKIKDSGVENYLNGRLAERGIEPVAAIREDPAISQSWMNGASIDATDHQPNIQRVIEKLESAECQSISA